MNKLELLKKRGLDIIEASQIVFNFENEVEQNMFNKNATYFFIKHEKSIAENQFDDFEVLETLYRMSKEGISFIDGDAYPVKFGSGKDAKLAIIMDFRKEKTYYEKKHNCVIIPIGLKKGAYQGRYLLSQGEQKIVDVAEDFQPDKIKVEKKQSQRGFAYEVATKENRNVAYIATARFANGNIWNYCETTENILMRAKSGAGAGTLKFYQDANAQDLMFEKFVVRQLMNNIPTTAGKVFDFSFGVENINVESAEIQEIPSISINETDMKKSLIAPEEAGKEVPKEVEEQKTETKIETKTETKTVPKTEKKTEKKKPILSKEDETWESLIRGVSSGKINSYADVLKYFEVPDTENEILVKTIFSFA